MRLAFGQLPTQPLLDPQKSHLMACRAPVLFTQLGALHGPAPPELSQDLRTGPSGMRCPDGLTAGYHLGIDLLTPL